MLDKIFVTSGYLNAENLYLNKEQFLRADDPCPYCKGVMSIADHTQVGMCGTCYWRAADEQELED